MNFKKLYMDFEKLYISFQSSSKDNVNKPRKCKVLKKWQVKSFQINVEKQDNITVSRTKVLMCNMHVIVKIINTFFHLNIIKCSKKTVAGSCWILIGTLNFFFFLNKVFGRHMSFFGATGTPVLDFW